MTTPTTEQRALWRRLAAEATPGKWWQHADCREVVFTDGAWRVGRMESARDAAFIAAAREAVPSLLDALERVEGERDEARRETDASAALCSKTVEDFRREWFKARSERDALALRVKGLEEAVAGFRNFGEGLAQPFRGRSRHVITAGKVLMGMAARALAPPATPGATPTNRNEE